MIMNDEKERIWKAVVVSYFKVGTWTVPAPCLERTKKITAEIRTEYLLNTSPVRYPTPNFLIFLPLVSLTVVAYFSSVYRTMQSMLLRNHIHRAESFPTLLWNRKEDNIRTDFKETEYVEVEWIHLAQSG